MQDGAIVELAGQSGAGKSTLLSNFAFNAISINNKKVACLDAEKGFKKDILDNTGLQRYKESSEFLHLVTLTYAEVDDALESLVSKNSGYDIILLDSMAAISPTKTLSKSVEEVEIGLNARIQSQFLKRWIPRLYREGKTFIFVNQFRKHIGMGFGESTEDDSYGAQALQYACDARLILEKGPKLARVENTGAKGLEVVTYGNLARLWAKKYRGGRGFIKVPCPIVFGKGVSNPYYYYILLSNNGYLTQEKRTMSINIPELSHIRAVVALSTYGGELPMVQAIAQNKDLVRDFLQSKGHFNLINENGTENTQELELEFNDDEEV